MSRLKDMSNQSPINMHNHSRQEKIKNARLNNKKYATIWRWHFYAGMLVAPFLLILSLSALGMMFMANTVGPNNV